MSRLERVGYLLLIAVAVAIILLRPSTSEVKTVTVPALKTPTGVPLIPANKIHPPRESSIHPDGYSPEAPPAPTNRLQLSSVPLCTQICARTIEGFEGFSSCPYWDSYGGVATRGYGETEGISMGSPCISRSYGERNLIYRAERFYGYAITRLHTHFNVNQVAALYSFLWNLGAGIMPPGSSLAIAIQHHNPYPLLAYDRAGGVVLAGLVTRRHAEVALFLKPAHEETPAQRRAREHRERVKRLHADVAELAGLNKALAGGRCLHGYQHLNREQRRRCNVWRAKHARLNRDVKRLRRMGIR